MLEGRLGDFRLLDLLQLISATAKSGSLQLQRGDDHARLHLEVGRVVDVATDTDGTALAHRLLGAGLVTSGGLWQLIDGADDDRGRLLALAEHELLDEATVDTLLAELRTDRLFDLLLWREGTFHFEGPSDQPHRAHGFEPVEDPLVLAARERLAAWPRLQERTGGADAVLVLDAPPHTGTLTLSGDRWRLLAMIDGRRTVAELARLWGQGDYRAHATLADLLDDGIVAPAREPDAGVAGRLTTAYATFGLTGPVMPAITETADITAGPELDVPAAEAVEDVAAVEAAEDMAAAEAADTLDVLEEHEAPETVEAFAAFDEDVDVVTAAAEADLDDVPAVAAETAFVGNDEDLAADLFETAPIQPVTHDYPTMAPPAPVAPVLAAVAEATDTTASEPTEALLFEPAGPRGLRPRVRPDRLRQDANVDAALVQRLIRGVEQL
ncbi:DUF4388 domain-containing protein [Egicoccus sp. AB-alg2]|uniref:DUF4388 domain-containing protein n=1 Tax=Egicoccus sp. AB-alg2 TaxID=3242693 RepID=UPI00359DC702